MGRRDEGNSNTPPPPSCCASSTNRFLQLAQFVQLARFDSPVSNRQGRKQEEAERHQTPAADEVSAESGRLQTERYYSSPAAAALMGPDTSEHYCLLAAKGCIPPQKPHCNGIVMETSPHEERNTGNPFFHSSQTVLYYAVLCVLWVPIGLTIATLGCDVHK